MNPIPTWRESMLCTDPQHPNIAAIKQHAIEQEIDALRERVAELEAAQQWRPIESAPKDFTSVFDGWNGDRVCEIQWARPEYAPKDYYAWCYSEYENGYGWVNHEAKGLTHWMPLPQPPIEKGRLDVEGHPV
jgi:hypothetical protein